MKSITFTYLFLIGFSFLAEPLHAQSSRSTFSPLLVQKEDSLKKYASDIVNAREAADRFRADSIFTRILVRALKEPYSFSFPFDSLSTISRLYAPDSSFRIFTWQFVKDESVFRRHGAIQMKTADGSLKLYPLIDKTAVLDDINNIVTNNENWIGVIYYRIIQTSYNGKQFYTLLGYDENSFRSTRKRIEVLTFDASNRPVFGGPYFSFEKDASPRKAASRFDIEYKKNGNGSIRYDDELNMIIFDHLISENNQPDKKYTYVPDGDYEGFKWEKGRWVHVDKVFNFKLQDGQAPVEKPLNGSKLDTRSSPRNN
ncbi:MAG: hypothetical protein KF746_28275 [Chitinophagaceae bacterium]|nr:hypothetical protein [Chitinophagaceae bacterium]